MNQNQLKNIKIDLNNTRTDLYYDIEKDIDLNEATVKFKLKHTDNDESIELNAEVVNVAARKMKVVFLASEYTSDDEGVYEGVFEIHRASETESYTIEQWVEFVSK